MAYKYVKMNDQPVPIERVEDEHEACNDYEPSFWWNNHRNFLFNFTSARGNPWTGVMDYPEYIDMVEQDVYVRPLLLEFVDGNTAVNIYEEREVA